MPSSDRLASPAGALGIIGHPVGHSLSPLIHNTALRALGMEARYVACDVGPGELERAIRGLAALGFAGVNVTLPYKESVIPLLDRLTERAAAVGAVNTIRFVRDHGQVTSEGDNTDEAGFAEPLGAHRSAVDSRDVVVLGAGGAARAVLFALLTRFEPRSVTVLARRIERADDLCAAFSQYAAGCRLVAGSIAPDATVPDAGFASTALRAASLIVQTTPQGMFPNADSSPWEDASVFGPGQLVYDLVYRPQVTRFMREAHAAGALVMGGLPMLIGQAAASFRIWTGLSMPLDPVRSAVEASLAVP